MEKSESGHLLALQILQTRMAFRQALQKKIRIHVPEMTYEMLQVMQRLWQHDGLTQQKIADSTAKEKASMTNLIDNLIKRGWVVRQEDKNDRRNKLICLTDKGKQLGSLLKPQIDGIYELLEESLGAENLNLGIDILKQVETFFRNYEKDI